MRKLIMCLLLVGLVACSKKQTVRIGTLNNLSSIEYDKGYLNFDGYKDGKFFKAIDNTRVEIFEESVDNISRVSVNSYIEGDQGKMIPRSTKYMIQYTTGNSDKAYYFEADRNDNDEPTTLTLMIVKERVNKLDRIFIAKAYNKNSFNGQALVHQMYDIIKNAKALKYDFFNYNGLKIRNSETITIVDDVMYDGDLWAIGPSSKIQPSSGYSATTLQSGEVLKYVEGFDISSIIEGI